MILWALDSFAEKYLAGIPNIIFPFIIIVGLFTSIIIAVIVNLKSVFISERFIEYRYTLIPLLKFKIDRSDIDGYSLVMEKRQAVGTFHNILLLLKFSDKEAIWIFKNGRLRLRLSSFLFSNFDDIKNEINQLERIKVDIDSSLKQFLYVTRIKKIKTNPNKSYN